jgi:hypothetical protein
MSRCASRPRCATCGHVAASRKPTLCISDWFCVSATLRHLECEMRQHGQVVHLGPRCATWPRCARLGHVSASRSDLSGITHWLIPFCLFRFPIYERSNDSRRFHKAAEMAKPGPQCASRPKSTPIERGHVMENLQ